MVLRGVEDRGEDAHGGFRVLNLFRRGRHLSTHPRAFIDFVPVRADQEIPRQVPHAGDDRREVVPPVPKPVVARLVPEDEHEADDDREGGGDAVRQRQGMIDVPVEEDQ